MENKCKNVDWRKWLAHIEEIPFAAYVVKNDDGLTLMGGNTSFYKLFDCSEDEIRKRYGGKLSALVDAEPLKAFPSHLSEAAGPVEVKQRVSHKGQDFWIVTGAIMLADEDASFLCCVSSDVTDYENNLRELSAFLEASDIAVAQAGLDYLEYDCLLDEAIVHSSNITILRSLADADGKIKNFVETMLTNMVVCPDFEKLWRRAFQLFSILNDKATYELQFNYGERGIRWVKLSVAPMSDSRYAVVLLEDITQEKDTAYSYLTETQCYQALLTEKDAYGHVDVTENRITLVGGMWNLYNEVINTITYSQLIEEFIFKVVHPEDRKHYLEVMQRDNFIQSFGNGIDRLGCEFRRIVEQNKMMWMRLSVYLFRNPITNHISALLTIQNVNEQKRQELLLQYDSSIDQLTRVYNRRMSEVLISEAILRMLPTDLCAFIVLDIDNFKQINDSSGHDEGDRVLSQLSDCLSHFFRRDDIVGRYGGDEFVIFLTDLSSHEGVEERLNELYDILRDKEDISCSAGVTVFQGQQPYADLFWQADLALYRAKNAGKGQFVFYDESILSEDNRRLVKPQQETELSEAALTAPFERRPSVTFKNAEDFDSIVGKQGDMAYLINPDNFDLICGNQAFYDRLGVSFTQCSGLKCYEAMHKRDTPCPFCSRANWSTDKFYLWRNMNAALEQEFLIKNKLITWNEREALLAIAIDISNDKSIVDSMDNGATETHSLLSGVQQMAAAQSLSAAIESSLETIGHFFRADTVGFWQYEPNTKKYVCPYVWEQNNCKSIYGKGSPEISEWLEKRVWLQSIMLESPEAMLNHSYNMYLYMKNHNIKNQNWVRINDESSTMGFIMINNSSSNLQNVAFLESFAVFLANELHKRNMIESTAYASWHDDLTDLLSRKSFELYIKEYAPDQIACIGVFIANLNNLKEINSTKGFQTGNYFLKKFALMLESAFKGNLVYRLNGDEFLVICPEVTRTMIEDSVALLEASIAEAGLFTASFGYSWDDIENNLSLLIEQATHAMEVHKKRYYDAIPLSVDTARRKMLNELVVSIENNEFEVFFQPKVELQNGRVIGAEALIRYHHKEAGYIQPAQFIDILEKNNIIRFIDLFVFEEVCKQLESWKKQGLFLPVISLNFSRLTLLERDILENMESIISRYDVLKKHVEIEITESVASMGKSILYQTAQDLYRAGYAIALDDFGTKYTNLAILADLDFNVLKVDRSIIGELDAQISRQLIMKNIISMCNDLQIDVLAEGIETHEQETILKSLNCQLGQGYLYGKPMPICEFEEKYVLKS